MSEGKVIDGLWSQILALNGGEAHAKLEFTDRSKIAVISVYRDQRPSNVVMDELIEWAEEIDDKRLLDKIDSLYKIQ